MSGASNYTWAYDANYNRAKYVTPAKTVIYLREGSGPTLYQKITKSDGTVQHRNLIAIGKRLVAQVTTTVVGGNSSTQMHYLHGDALNSITLVTDQNAQVVERFFYDAYGKRRQSNGLDAPAGSLTSQVVDFGFTGHEQLDDLKLVHMNGRIYDAYLGRFISADPYYQDPSDAQSFNRYSYVLNNPLRYADPSGFEAVEDWGDWDGGGGGGGSGDGGGGDTGGGGGDNGDDGEPAPAGYTTVTLDGNRTNIVFHRAPPPITAPFTIQGGYPEMVPPSFFSLTTFSAARRDTTLQQAVYRGELTRNITFPILATTAAPAAVGVVGSAALVPGIPAAVLQACNGPFTAAVFGVALCGFMNGDVNSIRSWLRNREAIQEIGEASLTGVRRNFVENPK